MLPDRRPRGVGLVLPGRGLRQHRGGGLERGGGQLSGVGGQRRGLRRGGVEHAGEGRSARGGYGRGSRGRLGGICRR